MRCACTTSEPRLDAARDSLDCVSCGGTIPRKRGRPPVADKRKGRPISMSDAEWSEVQRKAAAWERCRSCGGTVPPESRGCGCDSPDLRPMTAAAWLRMRAGV